jgi:hypothetical protein
MEAPTIPFVVNPDRLSLQLTDSHQSLGLGALKVRDLHAFTINQLVPTIHKVEVTTHNCSSDQND